MTTVSGRQTNGVISIRPLIVLILLVLTAFGGARSSLASSPGYGTISVGAQVVTSIAPACFGYAPSGPVCSGFWVQLDSIPFPNQAGTYAKDGAPTYENLAGRGNIVGVPGTRGYFIVTPEGAIISRGSDVPVLCGGQLSNCSGFPSKPTSGEIIVGVAATPSGQGLWAVGRDGKLWTAGDARPYGDAQGQGVITGIAATLSGDGYYIVASDGGVFSFGDAVFYGSTGGNRPGGHNLTGIAVSIDERSQINGYWLVGDDGGVHTFGGAPFWGSSGGNDGGSKVISIVSFPGPSDVHCDCPAGETQGYAWVHANGAIEAVFRPITATTPH